MIQIGIFALEMGFEHHVAYVLSAGQVHGIVHLGATGLNRSSSFQFYQGFLINTKTILDLIFLLIFLLSLVHMFHFSLSNPLPSQIPGT